jgi:serine/threonine-protein kinase
MVWLLLSDPMQHSNKHARSGNADLLGEMAGEYRIGRALGAGGFGTVYEAEHPVLKRRAAVKVLHENRSLDDVAVKRFIAEAQAASQIRHPNIVGIFSFGTLPNGRLFYVMDLLDGAPLDAYLREYGHLSPERAVALLRPIAGALDALHSAGVIHRDVKPANIFLAWESNGEVIPKLLDFGLIKLLGNSPVHTASDVLMGTPNYMAPEQCKGEAVDARSDVYSLGVICHELCTGQVPFTGDSASAVLLGHVLKPPPRMTEVVAELPPALDTPVLAMLAKDPAERPASAGAAFQQLEQAARAAGLTLGPLELPRPQRQHVEARSTEALGKSSRSQSGSLGPHERSAASKRGGRASVWPWGLLALGLAGGVGVVLTLGRGRDASTSSGSLAASSSVSSASAASGSAASSAVDAPASAGAPQSASPEGTVPATVRLVLRGAPLATRVRADGRLLGTAAGPLSLAGSGVPVELTLEAPGHLAKTLRVVPDHDLELPVSLERAPARAGKRGTASGDLENPF